MRSAFGKYFFMDRKPLDLLEELFPLEQVEMKRRSGRSLSFELGRLYRDGLGRERHLPAFEKLLRSNLEASVPLQGCPVKKNKGRKFFFAFVNSS